MSGSSTDGGLSQGEWQQNPLIHAVCGNLRYWAGPPEQRAEWLALPEWMRFFMHLGASLGSAQCANRITVAVAAPTRAYAAVSVALGVVLSRMSSSPSGVTDPEHIKRIASLPIGTSVRLRQGRRALKGLFLGRKEAGGKLLFGVQVQSRKGGGLEMWIPISKAELIELSGTELRSLPASQKGREVEPPSGFLVALLGDAQATRLSYHSQFDCAMVGRANLLAYEIRETELACFPGTSRRADGTLQEILRVRRFLGSQPTYRTQVYPSDRSIQRAVKGVSPAVVVFDGGSSFLRFRNRWQSASRVVVLDRTEPTFEGAAEILNQEYIRDRLEADWSESRLPPIPAGVEVMAFEEQRR